MTNSALLKEKMLASGYKMRFIAAKIGLTYQGTKNKIDNKHDFTASEIYALCELLHISSTERDIIFLAVSRLFDNSSEQTEGGEGMKLKIWERGVSVNGVELQCVSSVDVKHIGPNGPMEVVIHMDVTRVEISYGREDRDCHGMN